MRFKGHLAGTAWVKLFTAALLLVQSYAWGECHFGARGEGGRPLSSIPFRVRLSIFMKSPGTVSI
jgi:hypothetical protein